MYDGRNCESGCTLQTDLNVYNRDKTGIWRTPDACFVLCFICLTDRYRNLRNPCGCPCKNPKYNVFPVLRFLEDYMLPLKETGAVWGYDIPYLLTGRLNQHPSAAIDFSENSEAVPWNSFRHPVPWTSW